MRSTRCRCEVRDAAALLRTILAGGEPPARQPRPAPWSDHAQGCMCLPKHMHCGPAIHACSMEAGGWCGVHVVPARLPGPLPPPAPGSEKSRGRSPTHPPPGHPLPAPCPSPRARSTSSSVCMMVLFLARHRLAASLFRSRLSFARSSSFLGGRPFPPPPLPPFSCEVEAVIALLVRAESMECATGRRPPAPSPAALAPGRSPHASTRRRCDCVTGRPAARNRGQREMVCVGLPRREHAPAWRT